MKKVIALLLAISIICGGLVACDNRSQMEKDYDSAKAGISKAFGN